MLGVNILAHIMDFALPLSALGMLAGAAVAYVYVPLIGKPLSVGLLVLSATTFAYDLGFERRASLDKSASLEMTIVTLNANITEMKRQANEASAVADNARIAEQNAEMQAAANQTKVDQYVAYLASHPAVDCDFTGSDVDRLRGIGNTPAGDIPTPPKRPFDLWPVGHRSHP